MTGRLAVRAALTALALAAAPPRLVAQSRADLTADRYAALAFRYIGPVGNRVIAIAGRARRTQHLLRRRRVRRHLQDDRRRRALDADVRQPGRLVDRIAGHRAFRSEPRLGRHRRRIDPQQHLDRQRHLQVHRRRAHVDAHGPREDRSHPPHRRRPARTPTSSSPARSATRTGRSRIAASSARPTAGRRGRARCSSTRTPAARISRWT